MAACMVAAVPSEAMMAESKVAVSAAPLAAMMGESKVAVGMAMEGGMVAKRGVAAEAAAVMLEVAMAAHPEATTVAASAREES